MTDFPTEYRASKTNTPPGGRHGWRRSFLTPMLRRLKSFSDWLDSCWVGDVLGAATILAFMLIIPVFLPLIFEVFHHAN